MIIHNPILTGSFTVNGTDVASITSSAANITALNATTASLNSFSASVLTYTASQNILNGTYTLTSSFNAQTASLNSFSASILTFTGSAATRLGALEAATASLYTATSSLNASVASLNSYTQSTDAKIASIYSTTSSLNTRVGTLEAYTSSLNDKTSSFATTGSNTFIGNQVISGSVLQSGSFTSTGTLTAQTLVVQTITSSVDFVTGSTRFGSISANTHVFTGSMSVSGAAIFSEQLTATSPSTLFKEGFIVKATTTGGGGSQPAYTYYTAAGSKRWSSFLNVGDDKLHIANALNSEVFTIIQSGSVGIGTTSPATKLDVRGAARIGGGNEPVAIGNYLDSFTGFYSTITSNNHGDLTFGSNLTITTAHQLITTNDHPSMRGAAIVLGGNGYDLGDNTIAFFAESAGSTTAGTIVSASFADMVVKAGGNVGIGTVTPYTKLDIRGTSASAESTLQIVGNGVSTLLLGQNSSGGVIRGQGGSNALSFWTGGSGDTGAGSSGTEKMRITSIGTLKMATTTISNNNAVFGATDNGGYQYFSGDLANGEKFGSQGGTYIQGFYFISWYSTSGRGYAIFATVSPTANAGTVLASSGGWATASATYNASSAISLAFDGSGRGPVLSNNTGTTVSFYSYVFGGA